MVWATDANVWWCEPLMLCYDGVSHWCYAMMVWPTDAMLWCCEPLMLCCDGVTHWCCAMLTVFLFHVFAHRVTSCTWLQMSWRPSGQTCWHRDMMWTLIMWAAAVCDTIGSLIKSPLPSHPPTHTLSSRWTFPQIQGQWPSFVKSPQSFFCCSFWACLIKIRDMKRNPQSRRLWP